MSAGTQQNAKKHNQEIKCLVWDLDNTLWHGVLLEGDAVLLSEEAKHVIQVLDRRGILHSIASKNDSSLASHKVREFGLEDYFLYPQINWNTKSSSVERIAKSLNIGLDTIAFIDDDPFERDEVNSACPQVFCVEAENLRHLTKMPEMMPQFVTRDSKRRREMYLSDIKRNEEESDFTGPKEEFLATLRMSFMLSEAQENDLERAEELTARTHQLNSTGHTYSYEELNRLRQSHQHKLLVAELTDRYGAYGKIGLALVECRQEQWTLKLLLMSCRVMSRGVGTIMLSHVLNLAKQAGVRFRADFAPTDSNRMMYVTYKFAGFKEISKAHGTITFEADLSQIQSFPDYVQVTLGGE